MTTRIASAGAPPYLQSHPVTDERLNHLEAVLKTQQWAPRERTPAELRAAARAGAGARAQRAAGRRRQSVSPRRRERSRQIRWRSICSGWSAWRPASSTPPASALTAARAGGIDAADRELGCLALRQRDAQKARDLLDGARGARAERRAARTSSSPRRWKRSATAPARWPSTSAPWRWRRSSRPPITASACWPAAPASEGDGFYHLATAARLGGDYATALNQYTAPRRCSPPATIASTSHASGSPRLSDYLRLPVPESEKRDQ